MCHPHRYKGASFNYHSLRALIQHTSALRLDLPMAPKKTRSATKKAQMETGLPGFGLPLNYVPKKGQPQYFAQPFPSALCYQDLGAGGIQ